MPYIATTGDTYHGRRTCRRLHNTGGRIRRVETPADRDACDHCVDGPATCEVVKSDGEVCGRERPCPYHDTDT